MSAIEVSKDLSNAINTIEHLVNSKDGDQLLKEIRKFKELKNSELYTSFKVKPI